VIVWSTSLLLHPRTPLVLAEGPVPNANRISRIPGRVEQLSDGHRHNGVYASPGLKVEKAQELPASA
jgi:hypothetical protein